MIYHHNLIIIKFLIVSNILVSCIKAQNSIDLNKNVLTNFKCGDSQKMMDTCFKDIPPHLMDFFQNTKVPLNNDEISSKCSVFKLGMGCFDRYANQCLSKENMVYFQNNVAGARRFMIKLCDDREFQANYLRHKECFLQIQFEWERCTENFQNILADELNGRTKTINMTNKFMEFCCSRNAYEKCIYNIARYKCYKNSAEFVRETARMLTDEKHFSNCFQYESLACSSTKVSISLTLTYLFILVKIISINHN